MTYNATYAWDNEGRLASRTYPDNGPAYNYQYDLVGHLSGITQSGSTVASAVYGTAGQNNGQISPSIDHITGQQVNYTYDVLKRLTAAATVRPQWGQAYTYDGFGNMTSSTVTQGSGVNWSHA